MAKVPEKLVVSSKVEISTEPSTSVNNVESPVVAADDITETKISGKEGSTTKCTNKKAEAKKRRFAKKNRVKVPVSEKQTKNVSKTVKKETAPKATKTKVTSKNGVAEKIAKNVKVSAVETKIATVVEEVKKNHITDAAVAESELVKEDANNVEAVDIAAVVEEIKKINITDAPEAEDTLIKEDFNKTEGTSKNVDSADIVKNVEVSAVETKIAATDSAESEDTLIKEDSNNVEEVDMTSVENLAEAEVTLIKKDANNVVDVDMTTAENEAEVVKLETSWKDDVPDIVDDVETQAISVKTNGTNGTNGTKGTNGTNRTNGKGLSKQVRNIIRQVEYYFGDSNLHRDKFLLEKIAKDENGWVPVSFLLTFNRLAQLTIDVNVIVEALLMSNTGIVEISEDKEKIRRNPNRPMMENIKEHLNEVASRTALVRNFPLDTKFSELLKFFDKYEKVVDVTQCTKFNRDRNEHRFNGAVLVTFETIEDYEALLYRKSIRYKTKNLEVMAKLNRTKAKYISIPRNPEKLKQPDCVLYFEGANNTVSREIIRDCVNSVDREVFKVAYVEFRKGKKNGYIRFKEANTATKFLSRLTDNKLMLPAGVELTLRTLGADELKRFLKKALLMFTNPCCRENMHKNLPCHYSLLEEDEEDEGKN